MKLRLAALAALLAIAPALVAADLGIEFSGVLTADGKTRIALTDVATNATSWVEPGDPFNGYTVARYDPKEDAVFLKKDGQETRLGLVLPKTNDPRSARPALAGTPTPSAAPVAPIAATPTTPAPTAQPPTPASTATAATTTPPSPPATPPTPAAPAAANASAVANASTAATNTAASPEPAPAPVATDATTTIPSSTAPSTATTTPAAESSLPPTGRQTGGPTYTIQGGDTLEAIAQINNVSVQKIRELNPTLNTGSLRAGETIRIR